MAIHYLSSAEYFRKRTFDVLVPAYYHSHIPEEMKTGRREALARVNRFKMVSTRQREPTPFYQPRDPYSWQHAQYTLEIMVDMFYKKVVYQLTHDEDIVEILDEVDRYLITLQTDVETNNRTIVEYVKIVLQWREELYKHYYRYMRQHPEALARLYPNEDPTKNIFHLMSSIGLPKTKHQETDPLKRKAHPPYTLDELKPLPGKTTEAYEDLMGISMDNNPLAAEENFNFDDFLAKR